MNKHTSSDRETIDTEKLPVVDDFAQMLIPSISAVELPPPEWWIEHQKRIPKKFIPSYGLRNRDTLIYSFHFVTPPDRQVGFWGSGASELNRRIRWHCFVVLDADPRYESSQQGRTLEWWMPDTLHTALYTYAMSHSIDAYSPAQVWIFKVTRKQRWAPPTYILKMRKPINKSKKPKNKKERK